MSETMPEPTWVMFGGFGGLSPFSIFLLMVIFVQAVAIMILAWKVNAKQPVVKMVQWRDQAREERARPPEEVPQAPENAGDEDIPPPPPRAAVGGRVGHVPPTNITDNDMAMTQGVLIAVGPGGNCYHRPSCKHALQAHPSRHIPAKHAHPKPRLYSPGIIPGVNLWVGGDLKLILLESAHFAGTF